MQVIEWQRQGEEKTVDYPGLQNLTIDKVNSETIVVAWFDGEPDVWAIESPEGFESLRWYYLDAYGRLPQTIKVYRTDAAIIKAAQ